MLKILALVLILAMLPTEADAFGRRFLDCNAARSGVPVKIPRGIGLDIRINCGGSIADAQHPTQLKSWLESADLKT